MLFVIGIVGVLSGVALPMLTGYWESYRIGGDARGVANMVAVAKMRAAANFTQSRLYVDLNANSYHVERWQKTGTPGWVLDGSTVYLANTDTFGWGTLNTPPPNTQTTIGQASACLDATSKAIANTACVLFNSRGIPIDPTGAPTGADAVYLTDGTTAVYAATVSATAVMRLWKAPTTSATWVQQ